MDISSLIPDTVPTLALIPSIASLVAAFFPKPSDPNSFLGVVHGAVNLLAANLGHAKNADEIVQGSVKTANTVVKAVAPQFSSVIDESEVIAQAISAAYLAGHQTGRGADAARAVITAFHPSDTTAQAQLGVQNNG